MRNRLQKQAMHLAAAGWSACDVASRLVAVSTLIVRITIDPPTPGGPQTGVTT